MATKVSLIRSRSSKIVQRGFASLALLCTLNLFGAHLRTDGFHVHPGENIQEALDAAAVDPSNKVVRVHAGEYHPDSPRQALIWLNRSHDGIRLEAEGIVTLSAGNPDIANPLSASYPAIVNHVIYFGDGISSNTFLHGFRITGARNFVTTNSTQRMEPDTRFPKGHFFYSDGGAIKIFGRSYPRISACEIVDNYASPCAAGISVERYGEDVFKDPNEVLISDCIFKKNRARIMGAAVDLLPGVAVRLVNCLFVGNSSNHGSDYLSPEMGFPPGTNSAALTIFNPVRVIIERCTFTGNRNGVDDRNTNSVFLNTIFWKNDLDVGIAATPRYEMHLFGTAKAKGCFFGGKVIDQMGSIPAAENVFNAPDPDFDDQFRPNRLDYSHVGYRPAEKQ